MPRKAVQQVPRDFQKIGEGVYRVTGGVRRSAVTGKFILSSSRQTTPQPPAETTKKSSS